MKSSPKNAQPDGTELAVVLSVQDFTRIRDEVKYALYD